MNLWVEQNGTMSFVCLDKEIEDPEDYLHERFGNDIQWGELQEFNDYRKEEEEELYECEGADCDSKSKTKTQTKCYGALNIELCKDCFDGEYECGCSSFIQQSYIMWGKNEEGEEEEVYICHDCEDKWKEEGWVNSMDYKDYEEYEFYNNRNKFLFSEPKKKKLKLVVKQ